MATPRACETRGIRWGAFLAAWTAGSLRHRSPPRRSARAAKMLCKPWCCLFNLIATSVIHAPDKIEIKI